jgi:diketogulonate reductase-like aldo/keto reductase
MLDVDDTQMVFSDGSTMPMLGLGVWKLDDDDGACERAVQAALETGYRHFDTAAIYGNEASVGRALRASGLAREDIFIATKFNPTKTDALQELQESLSRLGLDYVDLYLVHWPLSSPAAAWPGMEKTLEAGLARSIGVSNFSLAELDELLEATSVPPVVNQVQFNPFKYRKALLEGCEQRDVGVVAYSPLGMGGHLQRETVVSIADRLGKTPAQVLIRWALQRRVGVIPKSGDPSRIRLNYQARDFTLGEEDLRALDALDETGLTDRAREDKFWER